MLVNVVNRKKTVFITGATGTMGMATLKEFMKRQDRFRLRLLVLDSKKDRKLISPFTRNKNIEIFYGNLKDADLIEQCVQGVDYVLHIGAMVSPMADQYPEETLMVNYGSTLSIIDAIRKNSNSNEIALVYIGTVGETGCRRAPIHWGRVGDPIHSSVFDYYGTSKIAAERAVFESGLKKWVSIRQTGMFPVTTESNVAIFHQNLNNVLEWITAEESGVLMANICEDWIPETFWRKAYNVGGGDQWRFTYWELLKLNLDPLGLDIRKIFSPKDFALYNFHGQWFTDSDNLNNIVNFRFLNPDVYFNSKRSWTRIFGVFPFLPKLFSIENKLKKRYEEMNKMHGGVKWMLDNNAEDWVNTFFGSLNDYNNIKSWKEGYKLYLPSKDMTFLDHGYDESKPINELTLGDVQAAAKFRGGYCVSEKMRIGDLFTPLIWKCHKGHEFTATPNLILKGGHWCDECERTMWDFADYAKHSPFFAQVWSPVHEDKHVFTVEKKYSDKTIVI